MLVNSRNIAAACATSITIRLGIPQPIMRPMCPPRSSMADVYEVTCRTVFRSLLGPRLTCASKRCTSRAASTLAEPLITPSMSLKIGTVPQYDSSKMPLARQVILL